MKKSKYSYIAIVLILSVVTLCVSGCLTAKSTATLPDGVSFTTSGTSIMSKTGLKGLQSDYEISPTKAKRSVAADVSTEAQIDDVRLLARGIASGVVSGFTGSPVIRSPSPQSLKPWELLNITEERWARIQSFAEASDRNGDATAQPSSADPSPQLEE